MAKLTTEQHFARFASVLDDSLPMVERVTLFNEYAHLIPHGGFLAYEESIDDVIEQKYLTLVDQVFNLFPLFSASPYLITPSAWLHVQPGKTYLEQFNTFWIPLAYDDVEEMVCELINANQFSTLYEWIHNIQILHFHDAPLMSLFIKGLAHADFTMSYYYDLHEQRKAWLPLYESVGFNYHANLTKDALDDIDFVYVIPEKNFSEIALTF